MASNVAGLLKGRWVIWGFSLFFAILAGVGVLLIVGKAADRVPYYVMSTDVAARTQITPQNVKQVDVNADALPVTAVDYQDVASGELFTTVPLKSGDIVTTSVTGNLTPINYELPPGFVAASLSVAPERAVGGKVKAGDFVDVAAVSTAGGAGGGESKVVMQNVQVLDVTVNPNSIAAAATESDTSDEAAPGPESPQVRGGIPQVYTLAVSPDNFAKLALIGDGTVWLALSQSNPPAEMLARASESEVFSDSPVSNSAPTPTPSTPGDASPSPSPSVPE